MTDCNNILSDKLKVFLNGKLLESQLIIKRKKRQMKIYKVLYYSTVSGSIIISALMGLTIAALPSSVLLVLPIASAILAALSVQFNFKDKSKKISLELQKLNRIKTKLEYITECNGDLTENIYQNTIKEFTEIYEYN